MKIGITGTREGMTESQATSFSAVIARYDFTSFHHGGCQGVDVQAARMSAGSPSRPTIICYPGPADDGFQEDSGVDAVKLPNMGHLARNREIVGNVDLLIVIPRESAWQERGGTWYTHDYAIKKNIPVIVIWPYGRIQEGSAKP